MHCPECNRVIIKQDGGPAKQLCKHVAFIFLHSIDTFEYESDASKALRLQAKESDEIYDNYDFVEMIREDYAKSFYVEERNDDGVDGCGMHEFTVVVGTHIQES